METYLILATLAVVTLWFIFTYNRFIRLRRFKDEAWSGISVQLKRRHDLAPNLLSLVKRYAAHEKELLEAISRQRGDLTGNTRDVAQNERDYAGILGRVFALAEAYPELKANENFLSLQQTLAEIEEQLQLARRYFNGTVRDLNIRVESFPSLIVARIFAFKTGDFFELEDPNDAAVPRMDV
ncbi:LemA family protein [Trabulsiella odontotermitis]|uniref:Membrane protein n=1 Tax=Trabulsiella odontotermitis TaxID=379893 RepID=A0A0L0H0I5_9ENTR|nr:LemA family protein [Trabulsiella odontotermitis]KNC94965.1 membrane protein [Trabulsiella odontotermitis]